MSIFTLQIDDATPCTKCAEAVPLLVSHCPHCSHVALHRLTFDQFFGEMEQGRIVSAKTGGLVVGRTTDEDDIPMYQHVKGNVFAAVGLMQGGEYLMSKAASIAHRDRIDQINAVKGKAPASFPISLTALCSVINTNLMPPWSGIWIDWGQYVVNRFATAQHFEELEELNADVPME